MIRISQTTSFRQLVPNFRGAYLCCRVQNAPSSAALSQEIAAFGATARSKFTLENLKTHPAIAATRAAYKICGKDPSRYRPASEQLLRRILQGKELYRVNELVDLGNLVSIMTGFPTGLLDADKVQGDVTLGIGTASDEYEGIGRGQLNVEGLPLYRDKIGGIASPTSDSTRTMLHLHTQHLLFIINGYGASEEQLHAALQLAEELLKKYAAAHEFETAYF